MTCTCAKYDRDRLTPYQSKHLFAMLDAMDACGPAAGPIEEALARTLTGPHFADCVSRPAQTGERV